MNNTVVITHSFLMVVGMCLLELLEILLGDMFDLLDIEQQTESEFQFYFCFVVFEEMFPDGGDIQVVRDDPLDEEIVVFL